jgi:uncharacterized membrane protein
MTVLALGVAGASTRYFSLNPAAFNRPDVYFAHLGPLLLHVGGGTVALAAGPWQFLPSLRAGWPRLHRWLGRTYVVAVLAAGVGGLLMAPIAEGGPVAQLGFTVLALELLGATAMAFTMITRGRIAAHRAWMIRSYALIFSAVSFRLWLLLTLTGLPRQDLYVVDTWLAPLVNLLVAEVLIGLRARGGTRDRRPGLAADRRGWRAA